MTMNVMKRSMSRMLKQSILDLCRSSIGSEGYVEIDGIVCITIGEEESEEIVVKVHEVLFDDDDVGTQRRGSTLPLRSPQTQRIQQPHHQQQQQQQQQQHHQGHNIRLSQSQNVASSQASSNLNKVSHAGSPCMPSQSHQSGPAYTQAGSHRARAGTPSKTVNVSQESKKVPPKIDDTVIKIEIESDDESVGASPSVSPKGSNRTACNLCDLALPSAAALKQHMSEVHSSFFCEVCMHTFSNKVELENHMKTHDKNTNVTGQQDKPASSPRNEAKSDKKEANERFKCGVCGNTSDQRQSMVDHLRSGHEFQGCYTCMLCREYFPNKPTFTIHRKLSHPQAKDIFCPNCGVGLSQNEYENHSKECLEDEVQPKPAKLRKKDSESEATPPSKRQCVNQAPSTKTKQNDNKGNKRSGNGTDKRPFECQICYLIVDSFAAYDKHTVEVHQRKVCAFCMGSFRTNRAIQKHMARHTNSMPFSCEKCGLGSRTEDEYRRHNIVSHNVQPSLFTCPQCELLLGSKNEFLNHMRETHDAFYFCDEELEKYVVLQVDGGEEPFDEEEEYVDEEGYEQGQGTFDGEGSAQFTGPGQAGYRMEEEEGEEEEDDEEEEEDEEGSYDTSLDNSSESLVTCNICELVMPSVIALKEHITKLHRAVVCDVCWRPFLTQGELDNHMKTHQPDGGGKNVNKKTSPANNSTTASPDTSAATPAAPTATAPSSRSAAVKGSAGFKCGVCGTSSEGRKEMVEHLRSGHEYLGCYTCMLCGEFFPNKPTFTIHRKLSHGEAHEVTCQICGVGLMQHEFEPHIQECETGGIDIKNAEWDGKKDKHDKA